MVLIPSRTGHAFKLIESSYLLIWATCLNPFEIRARVQTTARSCCMPHEPGLNPFEIRARVQTVSRKWSSECVPVLIPSRSGHAFKQVEGYSLNSPAVSLNPFEIRARVQTTRALRGMRPWPCLNPFEIRARVQTIALSSEHASLRLNPFEIRARVQTPRPSHN